MRRPDAEVNQELREEILSRRERLEAGKLEPSIVVTVNLVIPARQKVLTDQQARDLLTRADAIGVTGCGCRSRVKGCDAPLDVCLIVDMSEEGIAEDPDVRQVSVDEALAILDRTAELGLVHMTLWSEGHHPYAICSCCPCCCHELVAMSAFGFSDQVIRSDLKAVRDEEKCTLCMTCVSRCHFGAVTEEGDGVRLSGDSCFGCGLCVLTCPTGALSLVDR